MLLCLKKVVEHLETKHLHLNQLLAVIQFNENESTKFSPFYLLYNHNPVLPNNNILKPQREHLGEETPKIGME